eukprot:6449440-Prymnesium_polylepis.1
MRVSSACSSEHRGPLSYKCAPRAGRPAADRRPRRTPRAPPPCRAPSRPPRAPLRPSHARRSGGAVARPSRATPPWPRTGR